MIYIFKIVGTDFIKLGFTQGNPWTRVATGFWSNLHPAECCGKLGWDNLELVALFNGTKATEYCIKTAWLKPVVGEFWYENQLRELICLCSGLCAGGMLPLPERPTQPPEVERATEKLSCCGGPIFSCGDCNAKFKRAHHLHQHIPSCVGLRSHLAPCLGLECNKVVLKRNLKRHHLTCKSYRAEAAAAMSSQSALGME